MSIKADPFPPESWHHVVYHRKARGICVTNNVPTYAYIICQCPQKSEQVLKDDLPLYFIFNLYIKNCKGNWRGPKIIWSPEDFRTKIWAMFSFEPKFHKYDSGVNEWGKYLPWPISLLRAVQDEALWLCYKLKGVMLL